MDRIDEFLKHVSDTVPPHRLYGDPYYDQEFSERFAREYEAMTVKSQGDDPFTPEELSLLKDLLWQDERLPMFGDFRLARDHEGHFVYALAVRLLRDRISGVR